MVGHQAESQQPHGHVFLGVAQQFEEGMIIARLVKDGAAAIATVEDVVTVAAKCNSQGSCHEPYYGPDKRLWQQESPQSLPGPAARGRAGAKVTLTLFPV